MNADQHEQRGDRYELRSQLGSGGFGTVHLAYDRLLRREVALKELRRDLAEEPRAAPGSAQDPAQDPVHDPSVTPQPLRARLLREVQITGQLEHPGIVPVYDLTDDGQATGAFYTMRLVRGQKFEEAIAQFHAKHKQQGSDRLALPRLLTAVIGICNAIGYAHSRGVMHRDLKPGNVVLGEFGEVVLLDWGLAKVANDATAQQPAPATDTATGSQPRPSPRVGSDTPHQTALGGAVGTPAYMAPEQARGTPAPRTDIYGLGAILFEVLTGRPPHEGQDSGEVLERILSGATPRARDRIAGVPRPLDAICARAMERDPDGRYPSPAALAEDLQRWLADEPVSVLRENAAARAGRFLRRHRTWTLAALLIAAVTITVTSIAAVLLARHSDRERTARLTAESMREQGLHLAAKFAARTIASEIDVRWRVLEAAALHKDLVAALQDLRTIPDLTREPQLAERRRPLQRWVEATHKQHETTATATSWFVTDDRGRHLARSPLDPRILGRDFSFRDYFHGQGRDLTQGAQSPPPILSAHRSVVFKSQATKNLMVAFSVPITSDLPGLGPTILGILAMTVELGTFAALQVDLQSEQVAVLIETEADWIDGTEGRGLVLHHPLLDGVHRLDRSMTDALLLLRERQTRDSLMRRDYRDPVAPDEPWLAVFEPVFIRGRTERQRDTGWIIAVQERVAVDGRH